MPQHLNPADFTFRIAVVCICVALSTWVVHEFLRFHDHIFYLPFLPTVALCCLLGGLAGGMAATALCGLSLWYFFMPPDGFALPNLADAIYLAVFLGVAGFMCWVIHVQRRSNEELMQENFELGYKLGLLREARSAREPVAR